LFFKTLRVKKHTHADELDKRNSLTIVSLRGSGDQLKLGME